MRGNTHPLKPLAEHFGTEEYLQRSLLSSLALHYGDYLRPLRGDWIPAQKLQSLENWKHQNLFRNNKGKMQKQGKKLIMQMFNSSTQHKMMGFQYNMNMSMNNKLSSICSVDYL